MGKTSKPVRLLVDLSIIEAAPDIWKELVDQGHTIDFLKDEGRVIVAPYAMRMTAAMVRDLPKSIELLIKGARVLQHPAGTMDWQKGKPKRVANPNKGKRKNSKKPVENHDSTGERVATEAGSTGGGEEVATVGTTSDTTGNG